MTNQEIVNQAMTDTIMGLDRSLSYAETEMQALAYRIGQAKGEKQLIEDSRIARRSRSTWSARAQLAKR